MNRCESKLLTAVIAEHGPNGIAKFAALAGVSVSTIALCIRGEAPRKLTTRVAIASSTPYSEAELFPPVGPQNGKPTRKEGG